MCGRYTLAVPVGELVEVFHVDHDALGEWPPRFNLAPTQDAPTVVAGPEGERRLGTMRWGLVPFWADDPSIGNRMINARAETAASKPAFRQAFRKRRCLVPADGFFEWRRPAKGSGGETSGTPKTPFWIHARGGGVFAMAGLWERWQADDEAEPLYTFTLLTTEAPAWMRAIHHRSPLILPPDDWGTWLDRGAAAESLEAILESEPPVEMEAVQVSTRVNRPANEGPENVAPVADGERIRPDRS